MLSTEYILTLYYLNGFGTATIKKVADLINKMAISIDSIHELYDILDNLQYSKAIIKQAPCLDKLKDAQEKAVETISKSDLLGIKIVSLYDSDFPQMLLQTIDEKGKPSVPPFLFYKGDIAITRNPAVAIIGTREPTKEGLVASKYIASKFAENGFNIVSGLARGCDTAGHEGALSISGGLTTAFLAHGLDRIYPPENEKLAREIIEGGGLLMSEYPVGVSENRYNFVARDRLLASLAHATIVIQTTIHGGTMHAANTTLSAQKPLYVVEYSKPVSSNLIAGNMFLTEQGAVPITATTVMDVISELKTFISNQMSETQINQKDTTSLF